ncbi:Gibberellin 20 oxidase 2, partial [Nymphaea thermarum]
VKKESERRSLAFFLCPNKEKTVRPPEELLRRDGWRRAYPDFTWAALFDFTQKHYRADMNTLDAFSSWTCPELRWVDGAGIDREI